MLAYLLNQATDEPKSDTVQHTKLKAVWRSLLLITIISPGAGAQPRLGLVLGGGGAKGFAHIGVLKVLEKMDVRPDYITGTSMGAIIGALYAIGYSAPEIERIMLNLDWSDLFDDEVDRKSLIMGQNQWDGRYFGSLPIRERRIQLPPGLIPGQKISKMLSRLTINVHHIDDFSQFQIPFACVATDITNGEAVVLDHGFLPEALRASMAIPSIFSPIRVEDRLLVDGGLVRNLPAQDARALGADYVIAVDVSSLLQKEEELNSFLNILAQTINLMMEPTTAEQRKLCDLVIAPDMQDITILSFGQAKEAIAIGEAAALKALQQLPDSIATGGHRAKPDLFTGDDSIFINSVAVDGLKKVSRELVLTELEMTIPGRYTLDDLEASTQRVYSCQFFERVTYKIVPDSVGSKLIVRVAEKSDDTFRFGLRYNTSTEASVILNASFRNLAQNNSFLNLDLLLGQQILVDATLLYHTGKRPGVGLSSRVTYNDIFMDVFDAGQRRARLSVKTYSSEHLLGNFFATRASFSVGMRLERTNANIRIAASDSLAFSHKSLGFVGTFSIDTFDRANYPMSGVRLDLRNDVVPGGFGDNDRFSRHFLDFNGVVKLGKRYVLTNQIVLGTTTGDRMPLHYNFILGGIDAPLLLLNNQANTASFVGLKYQEHVGEHIQYLEVGLRIEPLRRIFITAKTSVGNTFDKWNWDISPGRFEKGLGVSAGILTPVGPIELTLMSGNQHDLLTYLNVGFRF